MMRPRKDLLELKTARQMLDRLTNIELGRLAVIVGVWRRTVTNSTRLATVNMLMMAYGRGWRYRDGWYMVGASGFERDTLQRPLDGEELGGTP